MGTLASELKATKSRKFFCGISETFLYLNCRRTAQNLIWIKAKDRTENRSQPPTPSLLVS